MSTRELRTTKRVKYSEDSETAGEETARPTRGLRVTAREAARVIADMDDSDESQPPSRTRQKTEKNVKKKKKDESEEEEESDSDQDSNSATPRTKGQLVAKKPTTAQRRTRSVLAQDDQKADWESYQPAKRSRQDPKPRAEPAPAAVKPRRAMPNKQTKNKFVDTEEDKKKRLEYLLRQSESFAHMMTSGGMEKKKSRKKAEEEGPSSSQQSVDHRHARRGSSEEKKLAEVVEESPEITRFEKTPFYIQGGEMRDYQIRGLNWLISLCENNINGILADEMGLGKTLQTISLLGWMYNVKKSDLPHLIIVPKSTLSNWQAEFKKWCPSLDTALLKGDQDERDELIKASKAKRSWDVLITSYEIVLREQSFIRKHYWGYVVVDEAHRIKNESAMLSTAVRTFRSARRLLLTGTPLQNNLHELWALLNFLLPDVFESSADFDSWFGDRECHTDVSLVERLHSILRPFLLRRVKADVEKNLPPKTEIKLFVGLTPMQRTWYRNILLKDISVLNAMHGTGSSSALHNLLMHLRKCCNHPYLFEGAEVPPFTTDRHIVDNCGKMILLDKLLTRLKEKGSRVLIFSQMTRVLDILEDYCAWKNYEGCRLDGSTAHEDREEAIRDFNAPNSNKFLFLLSTRAGGLGINLTTADTVILYDSDWNPQVDLQAMDRVHRIGQTKPVTVFRLITENTVEERIIERAERKMRLDALVIQSGRLVEQAKGLGKDEISKIIRFGAQSIIHSTDVDINNITDLDIDTILEKGKIKTDEMSKKLGELPEDKLRGLANDFTEKNMYQFEGEDFKTKHAAKLEELEENWIALPKRERRQLYDLSGASTSTRGRSGRDSPPWIPGCDEPKPKKVYTPRPPIHRFIDIHFAPPRLLQLLDLEQLYYKKATGYKPDVNPKLPEVMQKANAAEQVKLDAITVPRPVLTPEEEEEKVALLQETFSNWRRSDIPSLLRGLEQYGPSDVTKIAPFLRDTKSLQEVAAYLPVFLEKYETLVDAPKIKIRLQRGVANQEKQKRRREAIKIKLAESGFPEMDMKIPYPNGYLKSLTAGGLSNNNANARMNWLEDEDRYLLCAYGAAAETFLDDTEEMMLTIRDAIRSSPRFRFDYLMRSVTTEKVKDRLEVLLNWVVREIFPVLVAPPTKMPGALNVTLLNGQGTSTTLGQTKLTDAPRRLTLPGTTGTFVNQTLNRGTPGSGRSTAEALAASFPKNFTLKYVDAKEGKFLMTPSGSSASASNTTPSTSGGKPPTLGGKPPMVSRKATASATPTAKTQKPSPKVLTMSPTQTKHLGKSGVPIVLAKPIHVASGSSGVKASPVTSTGKKLPVWAMAADASASRSAASGPLRLKRPAPVEDEDEEDEEEDEEEEEDDEIVEVFATKGPVKKSTVDRT